MALVFALSACSTSGSNEFTGTRLDRPYVAPDIALTDTDGQPYSLASDTDKPLTLVFFGYTHCPDYCPMVMNNIAAAMNRLDDTDRDDVAMVFITTDPSRDTKQRLRAYLDGYDKSFIGLTGDLKKVQRIGDPLAIYVSDGKKLPSGGYDLGGHTTSTLALEGGKAVALWNQETSNTEFAADIHTLLTED
ncbi:MAG: SCO family protein [Nocardioidaceae bacterium]|nr:SCO family protein [Nocardioidaceae bacterium]